MALKLFLFSIGLTLTSLSVHEIEMNIMKEQAIHMAEEFVRDNGFTTFPPNKAKLSFDVIESRENNIDEILKLRYNILHPKAFCISENDDSWNVGFLSSSIKISELDSIQKQSDLPGLAIIVLKDGKRVRIAHKQPFFSHFNKL